MMECLVTNISKEDDAFLSYSAFQPPRIPVSDDDSSSTPVPEVAKTSCGSFLPGSISSSPTAIESSSQRKLGRRSLVTSVEEPKEALRKTTSMQNIIRNEPSTIVNRETPRLTTRNPTLANFSDEGQTIGTIESSPFCCATRHKMHSREESSEAHDFNACQTNKLKPVEILEERQIQKNTKNLNLQWNFNGIANFTTNHHNLFQSQRNPTRPMHKIGKGHEEYDSVDQFTHTTIQSTMTSQCRPRQRSRAIAIERAHPGDIPVRSAIDEAVAAEAQQQCYDSELYDYATWRMYNRIIDHRRKNLISQPQLHGFKTHASTNEPSSSNTSENLHISQRFVCPHSHMLVAKGQQCHIHGQEHCRSGVCEEDDEIFDLEL